MFDFVNNMCHSSLLQIGLLLYIVFSFSFIEPSPRKRAKTFDDIWDWVLEFVAENKDARIVETFFGIDFVRLSGKKLSIR